MELTINSNTENGTYATHYILTLRKSPVHFSEVISATHYKSSNKIDLKMPQGHTIRIDAEDDPIEAIKKELGVS